jgi:hypothetical protein
MRQTSPNLCGPSAQPRPCPVVTFQIRTVLSADPETTRLPSCENATDITESVWPFSSASTLPVVTFQIRTVLSSDPETTWLPSCEECDRRHPICVALQLSLHLARRHIPNSDRFVVRSRDDSAAILRECDRHHPICVALQLSLTLPVVTFQIRTVLSPIQRRLGCCLRKCDRHY